MGRIKPAAPIDNRLLIGIAGPQASGKTTSALRLGAGIVQETGGKICMIDTENKRALRYAKDFKFNHLSLDPPFGPDRYDEAVEEAEKEGYGLGDVIIIDSMSHEHEGPGGVLELHEQWLDKKAGDDYKKRDKLSMLAWNFAKKGRKRFITFRLQRSQAHIILCFRAKEKIKPVPGGEPVKMGFQPIGGDEYFFEMDIGIILPEGAQGKPDWSEKAARINEIGEGPLKNLLKNTQQISEHTGAELKRICSAPAQAAAAPPDPGRDLALKIRNAIKDSKSEQDLYDLWEVVYKDDLEKMKTDRPDRYDVLKKDADAKSAALKEPNNE